MSLLGLNLNLLVGPKVPVVIPPPILTSMESLEVTHKDSARSAFQIIFKLHRNKSDFMDYSMLTNPQFRVGNRVIIMVTINAIPRVLIDGIITHQQLTPGSKEQPSHLTLTGEDISVMMDKDEANNAIRNAWIAATISAGLTLIFAVTGLLGFDLSALWIVIVVLGLAFGVYKRNRACAVILFVFWVFDIILRFWDKKKF